MAQRLAFLSDVNLVLSADIVWRRRLIREERLLKPWVTGNIRALRHHRILFKYYLVAVFFIYHSFRQSSINDLITLFLKRLAIVPR